MPQNFISCDRDQAMLMPPSLLDWVPEDHVVWTILGAVDELDLSAFYGAYRADGHGRPAFAPSMMVALLLYAYSKGNRSSRGIERACREDVAYMVISAQQAPDHSTIAEFRKRHERALAELFTGVLGLCKQAGLVEVGVIAIDGTKIAANASLDANRDYEAIAREILKEAAETDRREDELYGSARGDELPEQLRTREGRRAALGEAKRQLDEGTAKPEQSAAEEEPEHAVSVELDPEQFVTRSFGRRNWFREARRGLDEQRELQARPIARSRAQRLEESARRLSEELAVEQAANAAYEAYRGGVMSDGRRFGSPPKPYQRPATPAGRINTTDQ
jgi:transposase